MKKNKTLLAVLAAWGVGTLVTANAQIALPENKGVEIGLPSVVSSGNEIESSVAPLMRSIVKKKSEVDLKTLDRELQKIEDDSLKDKIAREKMLLELQQLSSGQIPGQDQNVAGGSKSGVGFQQGPGMAPQGLPNSTIKSNEVKSINEDAPSSSDKDNIRVLLVYGFEENLKAKVEMGGTGGYVVQKGDVMPDGRKVTKVTHTFVEVQDPVAGKVKLPLLGNKPVAKNGSALEDNNPGRILLPQNLPMGNMAPIAIPIPQPQQQF